MIENYAYGHRSQVAIKCIKAAALTQEYRQTSRPEVLITEHALVNCCTTLPLKPKFKLLNFHLRKSTTDDELSVLNT
jgi:hypothetical protein